MSATLWLVVGSVGAAGLAVALSGGGDDDGGGKKHSGAQRIPSPKPKPQNDDEDDDPDAPLEGSFDESFDFGDEGGDASVVIADLLPQSNRDLELEVRESITPKSDNAIYDGLQPCRSSRVVLRIKDGVRVEAEVVGDAGMCGSKTTSLSTAVDVRLQFPQEASVIRARWTMETGLLSGEHPMPPDKRADRIRERDTIDGRLAFVAFRLDVEVRWRWL